MVHLRTVLLWLAFVLLIVLEFTFIRDIKLGVLFRLSPTFLLLIWFVIYLLSAKRYQFGKSVSLKTIQIVNFIRFIANITIVLGAIFKIMHWSGAQLLLVIGIGFLAVWSTLLSKLTIEKIDYNPDIIDDQDEDEEQ
ncbi:MAG: hypothetical protein V4613_00060 [Bacteroidota bacterium]